VEGREIRGGKAGSTTFVGAEGVKSLLALESGLARRGPRGDRERSIKVPGKKDKGLFPSLRPRGGKGLSSPKRLKTQEGTGG